MAFAFIPYVGRAMPLRPAPGDGCATPASGTPLRPRTAIAGHGRNSNTADSNSVPDRAFGKELRSGVGYAGIAALRRPDFAPLAATTYNRGMRWLQRLVTGVLPKRLADDMRAHSEQWRIRCTTCGYSQSVWESGGIRWRAASRGKRTLVRCPRCRRWRCAAVEREAMRESGPTER